MALVEPGKHKSHPYESNHQIFISSTSSSALSIAIRYHVAAKNSAPSHHPTIKHTSASHAACRTSSRGHLEGGDQEVH
jgi:hypothetical protein